MDKEYPPTLDELEARFWVGNRKASQLWGDIGPDLRRRGFTWPLFLRLLRVKKDLIVLHELGELSLTLLLGELANAAAGPLGTFILERGG